MRKQMKRAVLVLAALAGLSACQKQGSACSQTLLTGNRTADTKLMAACLSALNMTPVANMPTTGSATYNGYMGGNFTSPSIAGGDSIVADAAVTANFAAGTVSGTMSNVDTANQGSLGGTLTLSGATIAGNAILGANLNGVLTGYGSESITFATSGLGAFAGTSAQGIAINTTGTVTFSGATAAGTADLSVLGFK